MQKTLSSLISRPHSLHSMLLSSASHHILPEDQMQFIKKRRPVLPAFRMKED
jgi:hypothetical protein